MSRKITIRYDWSAREKQLNVIEKPREQIKKIENKKKTTNKKNEKGKKSKYFMLLKDNWHIDNYKNMLFKAGDPIIKNFDFLKDLVRYIIY